MRSVSFCRCIKIVFFLLTIKTEYKCSNNNNNNNNNNNTNILMMITIIIIIIIYNRGNLPGNEDLLSLRFYNIIVILILKTCTCV